MVLEHRHTGDELGLWCSSDLWCSVALHLPPDSETLSTCKKKSQRAKAPRQRHHDCSSINNTSVSRLL